MLVHVCIFGVVDVGVLASNTCSQQSNSSGPSMGKITSLWGSLWRPRKTPIEEGYEGQEEPDRGRHEGYHEWWPSRSMHTTVIGHHQVNNINK